VVVVFETGAAGFEGFLVWAKMEETGKTKRTKMVFMCIFFITFYLPHGIPHKNFHRDLYKVARKFLYSIS
jgi:hypothetical protein